MIRLLFVGKMGSRNGGERRKDRPSRSVCDFVVAIIWCIQAIPDFAMSSSIFSFFTLLLFFFCSLILLRLFPYSIPGIAMDGMKLE